MKNVWKDLEEAVAVGAPPLYRLRHPAFRIVAPPRERERNLAARWFTNAALGNAGSAALLSLQNLSREEFEIAFAPARLDRDEPPPESVAVLKTLFEHLADDKMYSHADAPAAALAALLDEPVRVLLQWDTLNRDELLAEVVLRDLCLQLATRILLTSWSTVQLEVIHQALPLWDMGRQAWLERLTGFPGLSYLIGTSVRQWAAATVEIVRRLQADLTEIRQRVFHGRSIGHVIQITPDLGDRHADGRSVAVLTFQNGERIVYKPKDLRCGVLIMQLFEKINTFTNTDQRLPVRTIITRPGYAWEEFVIEHTVTAPMEIRGFFESFGGILRILQLIEARDFWLDNLLIRGTVPDFADLECIFHPRLKQPNVSWTSNSRELYEESVIPTAAVRHTLTVIHAGEEEFGALSGPGIRRLPIQTFDGHVDWINGPFRLEGGKLTWEPEISWPRLHDSPAQACDFEDAIIGGYLAVQELLEAHAEELQDWCDSSAAAPFDFPVRVLMRDTWQYMALLRSSVSPTALLSGNERELALAEVLRTLPNWLPPDRLEDRLNVGRAELNALRNLDVPQFHSAPASSDLTLSGTDKITGFFDGSSESRFRNRVRSVAAYETSRHLEILRAEIRGIGSINRQ